MASSLQITVSNACSSMHKSYLRDLITMTGLIISSNIQIDFSSLVTLKFDKWLLETIGNLVHAPKSYVSHLIPIHEFNWSCHPEHSNRSQIIDFSAYVTLKFEDLVKLDESIVTDIWSHPCHYLAGPYTWPWSPNGHEWPTPTPFVQCQSALQFWDTAISKFDHENPWPRTWMWSKDKVTFDLENSKSRPWPRSNPLVTFEAWSSIDMFAFCFVAIGPLLVEV